MVFFVFGCSNLPTNPDSWMEMEQNACLPTAIAFRESLKKYNLRARVLKSVYILNDKFIGHSMVVYEYPKDSGRIYVYDRMGSCEVHSSKENPKAIASEALQRKYDYQSSGFISAIYIEE